MTFDTFTHVLEVLALIGLGSFLLAAVVGTWLAERSRGYRLSYESEYPHSHVRLIREDVDV